MNRINVILALAALAAISCTRMAEPEVKYGRLEVSVRSDAEITVSTKASDYDNYNVAIFSQDGTIQGTEMKYADFKPIVLPFGTYYVTAENCSGEEAETVTETGNGRMRLAGKSEDITLDEANWYKSATVACTVVNSRIKAVFDDTVGEYLTGWKVTVYTDAPSTTWNESAPLEITSGESYWINVGTTLTYSFTAIFTLTGKEVGTSKTISLGAASDLSLTFNVSSENGLLEGINISVDESMEDVVKPLPVDPYNPEIIN
ncbi:MAG: DUF4493 domain-containing protein [Candidatus Cryptobacteroides sp.]